MPSQLTAFIEVTALLVVTLVAALLAIPGVLPLAGCIWLATVMLACMLFLSWYRFDGGRHPCFLFLGSLFIFQGGRLLGYVLGIVEDPMQIEVGTPLPIHVPQEPAELTLLILVLSAVLVYLPCRVNYRPAFFDKGNEIRWLPALYILILLTFPFGFYKNYAYLSYLRAHGGYIAVYTDSAALLQSAGLVVRTFSLINTTAILVAYVFERRPKKLTLLLFLYFVLSTLDLLIGFRGKFFSQALGLWFLYKLKTGRRFSAVPLLVTFLVISLLAVLTAAFREEQNVVQLNPLNFLVLQGGSLNVTEGAVQYSQIFSRYGGSYVWWGFVYNLFHPPTELHHQLWTNDLSVYLNPAAAEAGYGTASSYLAELFLLGGIPAIALGSVLIGYCFNLLHRISVRSWGALLLAFVLPAMLYLPRAELLSPLSILFKSLVGLVPIGIFVFCYRSFTSPLRMTASNRRQYHSEIASHL